MRKALTRRQFLGRALAAAGLAFAAAVAPRLERLEVGGDQGRWLHWSEPARVVSWDNTPGRESVTFDRALP